MCKGTRIINCTQGATGASTALHHVIPKQRGRVSPHHAASLERGDAPRVGWPAHSEAGNAGGKYIHKLQYAGGAYMELNTSLPRVGFSSRHQPTTDCDSVQCLLKLSLSLSCCASNSSSTAAELAGCDEQCASLMFGSSNALLLRGVQQTSSDATSTAAELAGRDEHLLLSSPTAPVCASPAPGSDSAAWDANDIFLPAFLTDFSWILLVPIPLPVVLTALNFCRPKLITSPWLELWCIRP